MTSRDFCYWLMGYFELHEISNDGIPYAVAEQIKRHLKLVFVHEIDPQAGDKSKQDFYNAVHSGEVKMRC